MSDMVRIPNCWFCHAAAQIFRLHLLGIDITAETFMNVLDNGVYICDLANIIHKKAEGCVQQGTCNDVGINYQNCVYICELVLIPQVMKCFYVPPTEGGGHIVFGAVPVGVGVRVGVRVASFLRDIF